MQHECPSMHHDVRVAVELGLNDLGVYSGDSKGQSLVTAAAEHLFTPW